MQNEVVSITAPQSKNTGLLEEVLMAVLLGLGAIQILCAFGAGSGILPS